MQRKSGARKLLTPKWHQSVKAEDLRTHNARSISLPLIQNQSHGSNAQPQSVRATIRGYKCGQFRHFRTECRSRDISMSDAFRARSQTSGDCKQALQKMITALVKDESKHVNNLEDLGRAMKTAKKRRRGFHQDQRQRIRRFHWYHQHRSGERISGHELGANSLCQLRIPCHGYLHWGIKHENKHWFLINQIFEPFDALLADRASGGLVKIVTPSLI